MRHSETYRAARREAAKKLYRGAGMVNWPAYWFGINVPDRAGRWGRLAGYPGRAYRALKGGALAWQAKQMQQNAAFARAMVRGNTPRR